MSRLAPVPDAPPRAIGYVRVSRAREEMISPELQLTAIRDHCQRAGYVLAEVIEDLDLSGRFWKRRQVDRAITMIEHGDAEVLVVWKWSRVSRNRLDWAIAVDRVESAGGRLDSATEPVDTSTSAGRLQRGILSEFAAFESDRIGDVWREVHSRRTGSGRPHSGRPRWGYQYRDREYVPDPDTSPVLATLYRRYVAGESTFALCAWLNAQGYRTSRGYGPSSTDGRWTQTTLRRTLDSGFAAGLIMVRGEHQPGVHEPVIDRGLWEQYLATRATRRKAGRGDRSTHLLTGLMRCMYELPDGTRCDAPMGGGVGGSGTNQKVRYRCVRSQEKKLHPGGNVVAEIAEAAVLAKLAEIAGGVDEEGQRARGETVVRPRRRRDAERTSREIAALEQELATLTRQLGRELIPEAAYKTTRNEIEAEIAVLTERHASEVLAVSEQDAAPVAAQLLRHWEANALELPEKRTILRSLIARVEVVPGRPRASITVVPIWES